MPAFDGDIESLRGSIEFHFDRSGGPGGQNVNKVNTRVTLYLDLASCQALSPAHKKLLRERLATRISRQGRLRVVSQRFRSQAGNRSAVEQKLIALLRAATYVERTRRPTRPSRASKERRLTEKRRRSDTKKLRRRFPGHGD